MTIQNILIGEVWICSGQSNMGMPIAGWGKIRNCQQEITEADYPGIRHFKVPNTIGATLKYDLTGGDLKICSPTTSGDFSATAYFFARELYRQWKVPIGLVNTSWEGTKLGPDILSRLKAAGVKDEELPFVIFSPVELPEQREIPKNLPFLFLQETPPPFPAPSGPNVLPPLDSEYGTSTSVKVSDNWRQLTSRSYCMKRADGAGYVSMLDLQPSSFENPNDHAIIHSGRLELCVGLRWHLNTLQFVEGGASWKNEVKSKYGMSETTSYSLSATVGYSGAGASASLTATFGQSFTVTSETEITSTIDVQPIAGKTQTATDWDLRRCYVVKVDGVVRDSSNLFTVIFLDKYGRHQLNDTWSGLYDTISTQPSLRVWGFPQ